MNADAADVTRNVYIQSPSRGQLKIMCNWCFGMVREFVVFEGEDSQACYSGGDWLAKIVTHLLEEHPEKMTCLT